LYLLNEKNGVHSGKLAVGVARDSQNFSGIYRNISKSVSHSTIRYEISISKTIYQYFDISSHH